LTVSGKNGVVSRRPPQDDIDERDLDVRSSKNVHADRSQRSSDPVTDS
jgi:hypothetical protein